VESGTSRTGQTLKGKYKLEALLGRGGMGDVYRARNTLVNRTVAIKVMHPHHAANHEAVARFMLEAKAANAVTHRNIVDVLDIDKDDVGIPFIVQEYLAGEDLANRLERPPHTMAPDEALELLIPVIGAVGAAHSNGIIHRDLKPDNIFLANVEGETVAKILDFGISKVQLEDEVPHHQSSNEQPQQNMRLTSAGTAMGTPAYMSPEQIRDPRSVDARTDVWALGVMLYEVLSATMPFDAQDLAGLFASIQTQEPTALDRVSPQVPKALARIVHRCLLPQASARYPSAAELAEALSEYRQRIRDNATLRTPSPSLLPGLGHPRQPSPSHPGSHHAESESQVDVSQWDLDLDLPTSDGQPPTSQPVSSGPATPLPTSQPSSHQAPVSLTERSLDDVLDSDIKLELAEPVPSASRPPLSSRSHGRRGPRPADTAGRGRQPPDRGLRVRDHALTPSKFFGRTIRLLLAAALIAGLIGGIAYASPAGIGNMNSTMGADAWLYYGGGTLVALLALVWVAAAGMRRVSWTLFAAALGLAIVVCASAAITGLLAAPGLLPATFRKASLVAAPWGALATIIGLGGFASAHGRSLKTAGGSRSFAAVLAFAAVVSLGAAGYMLIRTPPTSLDEVSAMNIVRIEQQTQRQLTRYAVIMAGAHALERPVPSATGKASTSPPPKTQPPR